MEIKNGIPVPDSLDKIDQHIIRALQTDGRVPFAQIAEQLNVSPGMIRIRYNRMVEKGFVKVVAITDPLQMGYTTMAMIGIRTEGGKMLEVADKIAALDDVIYLIVVSGRFDLMAEVVCRDHAHLLRFLSEKLYVIPGVREAEALMHLKIVKEIYF